MIELEQVEVRGLKFFVRPGTSDIKAVNEVVQKKGYERRDFVLERTPNWLDYGANVGAFAVLAGSRGCNVVAYEADPKNALIAQKNVELNGLQDRVTIRPFAIVEGLEKHVILNRNSARGNHWRNSIVKEWRGGEQVVVEARNFIDTLLPDHAVKMDIEGAEMPLLEQIVKLYPARLPPRLVFEWSFDIDRSIRRFQAVVDGMRARYPNVVYPKFDESHADWPSSWFPPCRTVWCW